MLKREKKVSFEGNREEEKIEKSMNVIYIYERKFQ